MFAENKFVSHVLPNRCLVSLLGWCAVTADQF